ncbi:hypothetical protein XFF6970_1010007 [Xanthomonas citri pv. fuscans]|nr:hypothetical protein XFF6970_1010007 [Xanthomonas citri pv. fuscans]
MMSCSKPDRRTHTNDQVRILRCAQQAQECRQKNAPASGAFFSFQCQARRKTRLRS